MAQLDFKQIGLWILIWLVGYGLGLLEASMKEKNRKKKEKPEVIQAPPQLIEEDYALAIFEENNALMLKMDGAKLEKHEDLNENQRKRLINLVVGLRPWLEGSKKPQPSAPNPKAVAQPTNRPATSAGAPPPAPAISAESKIETQQPSVIIEHTAEETEYANLTMVQQIDWLLQKKLAGHPLKAKRIRLQGALTGGVEFFIGDQRYEYIDEIEDPAIREIFQQAIKEWEEKTTPGL